MDFNSQPREGGWDDANIIAFNMREISTHSRAKAAGLRVWTWRRRAIYFNSQPREGGWQGAQGIQGLPGVFQLTAARRRLEKP